MRLVNLAALAIATVAFAAVSLPRATEAATLGVQTANVPDIASFQLDANFVVGTGAFTVIQTASGANQLEFPAGTFTALSAGTFAISADLSDLSNPTGTLGVAGLTGDLVAVGNDGPTIELLWNITADPFAGTPFALGTGQALTLLSDTLFNATDGFTVDFGTNQVGGIPLAQADTQAAVIPLPAALPLLLGGLGMLGFAARWRRRHAA